MITKLIGLAVVQLVKSLGYRTICEALVELAKAWSKTTKTDLDDQVIDSLSQALEIPCPEKPS